MILDKEQLLKPRLGETLVPFDGGEVRVRSLSRYEALRLQDVSKLEAEAIALAAGLVEPEITEAEAKALLQGSSGMALQPLVDAILNVSGVEEGAQKSGGEGPDAGPG